MAMPTLSGRVASCSGGNQVQRLDSVMPYIEKIRAVGNRVCNFRMCAGGRAAAVLVIVRTLAARAGSKLRSCSSSAAIVGTSGNTLTPSLANSGSTFCGKAKDFSSTRVAPTITHINNW